MHAAARPLDAFAVTLTVALCLSWGFNQVAVKLAIPEIPPLIQAAIRSAGAALIVAAWARLKGMPLLDPDRTLMPGIVAGVLFGAEFLLIYRGLLWTTASRAVLFIYLAPFFVVLGARWFLPADRFGPSQWSGLAASFAGMVVAFGLPTPAADPRQLLGDIMMVAAAIAWAATTLVIKASALARISSEKTMLYQLVVSAPMLALGAHGLRRAHDRHAVVGSARLACLSDRLGGERDVRALVRADRALFGEPPVGLHLPDPAFRGRGRALGAGRATYAGFRGRGGIGGGRAYLGESTALIIKGKLPLR
jgi:drug/metabolite transporter (DMT)-like permease